MTWKNIQKHKTDILLLAFLTVLMVVSFYHLTKVEHHLENYTNWENRVYIGIDRALPKPENRKSNTIFYIKNSDYIRGKRDFYLECIVAAYYGKKSVEIIHENELELRKAELSQLNAAIYTIVVLEHVDLYKTVNVTNELNVADIMQYMNFIPSSVHDKTIYPILWQFRQTGVGGSIERGNSGEDVINGENSVIISSSPTCNSRLLYESNDINELRNQTVRFSVFIKSLNKTPNAVHFIVDDGITSESKIIYENSGEWERSEIVKSIDLHAKYLRLILAVDSKASAPAIFDNFKIDILPVNEVDELSSLSLETWVKTPAGDYLPKKFSYEQHGTGGNIEKCVMPDCVKDGKTSAVLKHSSKGKSFIRRRIENIDNIKGHRIRLSTWIKSANTTKDAVQIDIQDGASPVTVISYNNNGDWELVEVEKNISPEASHIFLTFSIDSAGSAPVYIDEIKVEVLYPFNYTKFINTSFDVWIKKDTVY